MKWLLQIPGSLPLGDAGVLSVQLNSTTLLRRKVLDTETDGFMSSKERVHTDSRQKADLLYRRPANQKESHSSITNKVHDASRVSCIKEVGDLSMITFSYLKEYIFNALN